MEYGEEALAQTIEVLAYASIAVTGGGGGDSSEARRPSVSMAGDTSIAMLGYPAVFRPPGSRRETRAPGSQPSASARHTSHRRERSISRGRPRSL
jgi:Bacterial capsule synthesis protein PGA_cap